MDISESCNISAAVAALTLAVITIAVGLFVWLGGFGLKKTMYALAGVCFGGVCTLFTSGTNLPMAAAIIGICAVLAFMLQETFLMLVASACAAVIGYSFLIRPYFRPSNNLLAVIRQIAIGVPYYNWPMLLAATALPFAVVSWRNASALLSSAAGAVILLAGTVMALLDFGYPAIGYMSVKQDIYFGVIALATIVGMFIQLMLLPKISNKFAVAMRNAKTKKAKARRNEPEAAPKSTTWRTA